MEKKDITQDNFKVFPVFIEELELKEDYEDYLDEDSIALINKIEVGRLYKAYEVDKGILVFPEEQLKAFLFFGFNDETKGYTAKIKKITTDNFHEVDIIDEDIPLLERLIDVTEADEIKAYAKPQNNSPMPPQNDPRPTPEEYGFAMEVLGDIDPKLARAIVELVAVMNMKYSTENKIDQIRNSVIFDPEIGRGACLSGAMEGLLLYTRDESKTNALVDATCKMVVELSRKLRRYA